MPSSRIDAVGRQRPRALPNDPRPRPFRRRCSKVRVWGEPEALAALFEACFDSIYGLAARMMGDVTLAEDVVQEVFLRLHKAAATIDTSRDPRPWLRTMTANLCRDHWRSFGAKVSRKAVPVDGDPDQIPPLANGGPTPRPRPFPASRPGRFRRPSTSCRSSCGKWSC